MISSRPAVLASRSTALGSEAVLAEQAKRELETAARYYAFLADRTVPRAAPGCRRKLTQFSRCVAGGKPMKLKQQLNKQLRSPVSHGT